MKKTKNKLSKICKDNKGIETRVLIYILAAVALIAAIGIVMEVNQQAENMVNKSMQNAEKFVSGTGNSTSQMILPLIAGSSKT